MYLKMLKGKIHRAVVKQAELNYVGSITVDPELLAAAGILEYENVQIVDIENGNRFETYTIMGEPGSGMVCLNGAAARQATILLLWHMPRWNQKRQKSFSRRWCLSMRETKSPKSPRMKNMGKYPAHRQGRHCLQVGGSGIC